MSIMLASSAYRSTVSRISGPQDNSPQKNPAPSATIPKIAKKRLRDFHTARSMSLAAAENPLFFLPITTQSFLREADVHFESFPAPGRF